MNDRRRNYRQRRQAHPNAIVHNSTVNGIKLRGTAHQIVAKCKELSGDTDDIVKIENFKQHIEHYQRLIEDNDTNNTDRR